MISTATEETSFVMEGFLYVIIIIIIILPGPYKALYHTPRGIFNAFSIFSCKV